MSELHDNTHRSSTVTFPIFVSPYLLPICGTGVRFPIFRDLPRYLYVSRKAAVVSMAFMNHSGINPRGSHLLPVRFPAIANRPSIPLRRGEQIAVLRDANTQEPSSNSHNFTLTHPTFSSAPSTPSSKSLSPSSSHAQRYRPTPRADPVQRRAPSSPRTLCLP